MTAVTKRFLFIDPHGAQLVLLDWGWGFGLAVEGVPEPYVAIDTSVARVIASVLEQWANEHDHQCDED